MQMNGDDIDVERLLDEPSYFVDTWLDVSNDDPDVDDEPFSYQREFMDHPSNRKIFVSGRRVGKSRTASWLALHQAMTFTDTNVLITAKAQRQSTELFNQVKREIRQSDIGEDEWGIVRDTRTEINFGNGSRIKCLPVGRDGSNIRGYGADMLLVDEAAFIDDAIFQEVLSPMLAVGEGQFILLSTPLDKSGFLYSRWDEATQADDVTPDEGTGWFPMRVPTSANPLIDDEFIEEQRKNLTRGQFRREILGQFDESSNKFFTREELMNCAHQPEDVESGSWRVTRDPRVSAYLGVDLGGQGADDSVYISIDANGNVFQIDSCEDGLSASMREIGRLHAMNDYDKIVVDATGLGEGPVEMLQEEIGAVVEGFKFTNEKKQSLYNTLKNKFQNGDISYQFNPNANDEYQKLFDQARELEYDYTSGGKVRIEHPSGGFDDYTDALALAVWAQSQRNFARPGEGVRQPFNMGSLRR